MKASTFIGILLTFLMLLIVLAAALFFLFSRQQVLWQRNDLLLAESEQLRQEATRTERDLAAAQTAQAAAAAAQATSEANEVILAGELVVSDQEMAALQTERDELAAQLAEADGALAELEMENQAMTAVFPFAAIVSPQDGLVFAPDTAIEVLIVAYDPAGITAVNLTIDKDTQSLSGNDEPLFTYRQNWQPSEQGEHTLSVMAINTSGKASDPVRVVIQLIDIAALNASIRSEVEANVIELTGLTPLAPIEPTFLTRYELSARIETNFAEESTPESIRQDALVLSAFDFLEPDYDLYQSLIDLYSEGVLGFYDPETAEFVVVNDDNTLDVSEQLTHAHEFVHALQDQYYDLALLNDDQLDSESSAAIRALAEGQATLVQTLYLTEGYLSAAEIAEVFAEAENEDLSFRENIPAFLVNDIEFPYMAGLEFVLGLYRQGGMAAIDEAWSNLPQSTEQILHLDRYQAGDAPQIVSLPPLTNTLGTGWQLVDEDTFGEFYLRQYLGQQLDESGVEMAAAGWGGDRYAVYENEVDGTLVMLLRLAWDSAADRAEFNAIYPQYAAYLLATSDEIDQDGLLCWPGSADVICLAPLEADSLVIRAPDVDTAVRVAGEFR